jgi:hypothetical protein
MGSGDTCPTAGMRRALRSFIASTRRLGRHPASGRMGPTRLTVRLIGDCIWVPLRSHRSLRLMSSTSPGSPHSKSVTAQCLA